MKLNKILLTLMLLAASTLILKAQWTTSVNDIYNSNTGKVTVGGTSGPAKFNVIGDANIIGKTYYKAEYAVPTATYVNININASGVSTIPAGTNYRVELLVRSTGTSTGAVYIVTQTGDTTWVAKPVNINTSGSNHPLLRIDPVTTRKMQIYHAHGSTYNVVAYITSMGPDNTVRTDPGFYGLDGAISIITGNVGIGTNTPENSEGWQKVLDLSAPSHAKSIVTTSAVQTGIHSHNTGAYGSLAGGMAGTSTNHAFSLFTNKLTRVTVTSDGNVGIGTTAPAQKLTVAGRTSTIIDSAYGFTHYTNSTANTSFLTTYKWGTDFWLMTGKTGTATEPNMLFATAGYERMRINTSGNVSIGTSISSGSRLVVVGGTLPTVSSDGAIHFSTGTTGRLITGDAAGVTGVMNTYLDGSNMEISSGSTAGYVSGITISALSSVVSGSQGTVRFWTAGTERMRITSTGNIAIGTDCVPSGYKMSVKGNIICEKLKVKPEGGNCWADYVFEPDYNLIKLAEVELFIKQNKHLPGVPGAAEVAENGIEIAEMDATLLKKIEELTLYMIQQNRQLEEQHKRLEKLEAENAVLKEQKH